MRNRVGGKWGFLLLYMVELLRGISERGGEGGLEVELEGRRKMKGNVCKETIRKTKSLDSNIWTEERFRHLSS